MRMPVFEDVQSAARALSGHALCTPVRTCAKIDAALGASLFFKCENLQRGGAFKFLAASATAWAWLPEEKATTPRPRASGPSRESAL